VISRKILLPSYAPALISRLRGGFPSFKFPVIDDVFCWDTTKTLELLLADLDIVICFRYGGFQSLTLYSIVPSTALSRRGKVQGSGAHLNFKIDDSLIVRQWLMDICGFGWAGWPARAG
jgi:hypothetical protein